jgi:PAS domain S-box-containing protein
VSESRLLRILHVEDEPLDRELVAETLRNGGLRCEIVTVDREDAFVKALTSGTFDVVLSDDSLPRFDGRTAQAITRREAPHLPFIVVSGTLGEEVAIERLKDGATDYVLKQRLSRLPQAITRAIREAHVRAEREQAAAEVLRLNAELEQRVIERTGELAGANKTLAARERELAEARDFLENLLAASPSMIFRIDPTDFRITYASPNVVWLLGYDLNEIIGVRNFWRRLLHPEDLDRAARHLQEAFTAAAVQIEEEYRMRAKDGRYRWTFSLMRVEYDEKVRPTTLLWYCGDISDRRAAEQALLESEERTKAILRTANDAFVALDLGGRILDWNAQAERMFGWLREEAIGRMLVGTIFSDGHHHGLSEYLTDDGSPPSPRLELVATSRDGTQFPVELTIWTTGSLDRRTFNAFIRDITEQRRAQTAIRKAQEEAERANRAKSEFLSRMSHDLRTPLNAVLGFAQLLTAETLNDSQRECTQQILKGGRHLLDLINEVLDIARIESGRLSLSPEPVDVLEIVRHVVDLVSPLAAQRQISLVVEQQPAIDASVLADRQRLNQILLNLLSNAVKYNRAGGRVTLSFTQSSKQRTRIHVTDTGAGIPPEKLRLLFRPFERLGAETTGIEGTGLGLTLSRGLAEAMGGSLGVSSEVDRGSTFWVELLATDEAAARQDRASLTASLEPTRAIGPAAVLYIEDNASNVRLMHRLLGSRPSVTLLHGADGQTGLQLARERRPDVILLDLHLPDMSGEEVLQQLWGDPSLRGTPVIVLSADATPSQMRRVLASGATAYLTKPLDLGAVLEVIDRSLLAPDAARRTSRDEGRTVSRADTL